MSNKNKITLVTRQNIASELTLGKIHYSGKMPEPDFLYRHFDLTSLPSEDKRYSNAFGDIRCHTVTWPGDMEDGWVWSDRRFNLLYCPDDVYLKFLCDTIHSIVRAEEEEAQRLLAIYNQRLATDGFEIYVESYISSMPVYGARETSFSSGFVSAKPAHIKKYLNTDYVRGKIKVMTDSIDTNPDLAIGTSKELIETVCKSILKSKGIAAQKEWELQRLFKETISKLDYPGIDRMENPEAGRKSLNQMLGGMNSAIQGLTELRNGFGSGHGKAADFVQMDARYVRFLVGIVSDIAVFILSLNGETTELNE